MRHRGIHRAGISLVEVVIVLAISAALVAIVVGTFAQRTNFAVQDSAAQVASSITAVQNEAKQGLGPTTQATGDLFNPGETIYGEAIAFDNGTGCATRRPCLLVYKLKANAAGTTATVYEKYEVAVPAGLEFYNPAASGGLSCSSGLISCVTNSSNSTTAPTDRSYVLLIKNGSGDISFLPSACQNSPTSLGPSLKVGCASAVQGSLKQAVVYRQTSAAPDSAPAANDYSYYLNINLGGNNDVTVGKP